MLKLLFIGFFVSLCAFAVKAQQTNPQYDAILAQQLQADDYGMKMYVLAILKTGDVILEDKTVRDSLFAGHMQNIRHLVDIGKMIVAGPLMKNDNAYRGIFILNTESIHAADSLVMTDPAIQSRLLLADLYQWYGSAALPLYLDYSEKIWKAQP
jgi:uncharacterized protein